MQYTIGIDVGGTNTDIVVVDENRKIITARKVLTSIELEKAIYYAIKTFIDEGLPPIAINRVFIGTTAATNAILEVKNLLPVGLLRIAGQNPMLPAGYEWPKTLRDVILRSVVTVGGGYECQGTSITPFSASEVEKAGRKLREDGAESIAIIGVYSPLQSDQEREAKNILRALDSQIPISCSSDIGGIGFLQRESATLLNASLKQVIAEGFSKVEKAVTSLGILAPIYMVKNDGSIMNLSEAIDNPIFTIAAGQTNSFKGAAALTDKEDLVVVDIGGTSTDIGVVKNGVLKRSCHQANIGGVTVQFPMPDALSLAIGGGSIITINGDSFQVGPSSVSKDLRSKAVSFGGDVLTLTDVALLAGRIEIEGSDTSKVAISKKLALKILTYVDQTIDRAIQIAVGKDRDLDVSVVGGAAAIYNGAKSAPYASVANAFGSTLSEVMATVDIVTSLTDREKVLHSLKEAAIEHAVMKGAVARTVKISNIDITPYAYSKNGLCRVIISASGSHN